MKHYIEDHIKQVVLNSRVQTYEILSYRKVRGFK